MTPSESTSASPTDIGRDRPLPSLPIVVGMLAPGLAFLLHLELVYAMTSWICQDPAGRRWMLPVTTAVMAIVAAASALPALLEWRRAGAEWKNDEGNPRARSRFMAIWAMGIGALCVLAIIAMGAASFFYSPCDR
jgi:hypothetical protein